MSNTAKKKILVAMSGGVDSSVAAALLKEQGYDVFGGFMKNFSDENWYGVLDRDCPWEQDQKDVEAVCRTLGIGCRSFNFEKEYIERIISYFFAEYGAARTPNPDILCNSEVKFHIFLEKAKELGFDAIATGHYARIQPPLPDHANTGSPPTLPPLHKGGNSRGGFHLLKGVDPGKDQSYFLYRLNQEQLSRSLFPIGIHTKAEIRDLAKKYQLPNAEKKDSQGLCFIGHIELKEFLSQRIDLKKGPIVDIDTGQTIGEHDGVFSYTIGQRKGIKIGGAGEPYYVADKDVTTNTLTVAQGRNHPSLYKKTAEISDIHWIHTQPSLPLSCTAKIRYHQPDQSCTVKPGQHATTVKKADTHTAVSKNPDTPAVMSGLTVTFTEPQFAVAPGQSIVLYDHDTVLGGGVIV